MEKQEAINFIHQRLEKNCSESDIAEELSQIMGVPNEIVRKFVDRVVAQNTAATTLVALSTVQRESLPEPGRAEFEEGVLIKEAPMPKREGDDSRILLPVYGTKLVALNSSERMKIWLQSSWKRFKENWKIFSRNKLALVGLILLLIYVMLALMHPLLMSTVWPKGIYNPVTGHDIDIFPHPSGISAKHILGTDTLGRDVLSVLMAATGPSLMMAFTATITATILGTVIGALSAYYRGMIDGIFSNLADISLLAPAPLIMVIIGFVLDIDPVKFGLIFGILAGIGVVAIVLRSHALAVVSKSYIQAAQVAGGGSLHILMNHVFPHLLPLAAVSMLFTVTGAIFASGFIAFLGLSRAQLNWGSMIYDAFTYEGINGILPWNVLIPSALAISLFAASFYLIALGLQDVVEPRKEERRLRSSE